MPKKIKFKCNVQGDCPLCRSESLEYEGTDHDGDAMAYKWTCKKCGANGKEWYNLNFDTHGNVVDKKGKEILNESGY